MYEDIRVEQFEHGKLIDIQIKCNKDYNTDPGKLIENVKFKNIIYDGFGEVQAVINGFDNERKVNNVIFENMFIRGKHVLSAEQGNINVGKFVSNIVFK